MSSKLKPETDYVDPDAKGDASFRELIMEDRSMADKVHYFYGCDMDQLYEIFSTKRVTEQVSAFLLPQAIWEDLYTWQFDGVKKVK